MNDDAQPPLPSEEMRAGIRDQLAHLIREGNALGDVIGRVPEEVLATPPPDEDWSIKETFGLLTRWDEAVYPRWIERIAGEDAPRLKHREEATLLSDDTDWNETDMAALLARMREARGALIETLEALPPRMWSRTGQFGNDDRRDVYAIARDIARRDHVQLRRMTRRLHERDLSTKQHDVPQ